MHQVLVDLEIRTTKQIKEALEMQDLCLVWEVKTQWEETWAWEEILVRSIRQCSNLENDSIMIVFPNKKIFKMNFFVKYQDNKL